MKKLVVIDDEDNITVKGLLRRFSRAEIQKAFQEGYKKKNQVHTKVKF